MKSNKKKAYIHGYSEKEQKRLNDQASFSEFSIFENINYSDSKNLIEIGCGVGAQTEILLRRFPKLKVTGIDFNKEQLKAAEKKLLTSPHGQDRWKIHHMDAGDLKFESGHFDSAYLCWILEHVPDQGRVLNEARRVLGPGAQIVITEILNSTFFLEPYSPNVLKYWMAFNDFQIDHGGDPFVGAKLGNLLLAQGFRDIKTTVKTWHFDNRFPGRRKEILLFWTELLLSASEQLIKAKYVKAQLVEDMKNELQAIGNNPNAVFFFSFIQAQARVF